jgi:hypothetical protein
MELDALDDYVAQAQEQFVAFVVRRSYEQVAATGERDYLAHTDLTAIHASCAQTFAAFPWRWPSSARLDYLIEAACQRLNIAVVP